MLNLHHLRYFWAVAHEQNLTRAAARLHVSQSAVSTQIKALEESLGHALFERRGKALSLTEAGRIALEHADVIFAHGRDLESALAGRARARQVLRVGSLATLSRNFQLGFLRPVFRRDDVELVVRSGALPELLRGLEAHQLDVVLANVAPPRDAAAPWVPHPIAEQPVALVGPKGRARRREDLAAILRREPVLLPTVESSIRAGFDALCERLGVHPRIAAEVDDMAMLRLLAGARLGLAVVPPIVVQDELAAGALVQVAELPLVETFYAVTRRRRFPNPVLAELLRARARP